MTLELLSAGAGGLHPPCPHLHQQQTPHYSSWSYQGSVGILNISKPPCCAPFPGSVVALSHPEGQGRNLL